MKQILAIIAVTAFAAPAFANSVTGNASVSILQPLILTQSSPIVFGDVMAGDSVSAEGIFTVEGLNVSQADFTVSDTVVLNDVREDSSESISATLVINEESIQSLGEVGSALVVTGTLDVPQDQPAGTYTGTYTLTANY